MGQKLNETEKQTTEYLNEKQSELSLTVKEAAKHIEESPHVIRNWMRELKSHIPTKQGENGYHYFDQKAIERLLLIKELSRDRSYSIKQIEYYLSTGQNPKPEKPPEDQTLTELKLIKEHCKLQEEFNMALIQRLDQQQQYIAESLNKRDQLLIEALKESQQARIETVEPNKKGFFSRLFTAKKDQKAKS